MSINAVLFVNHLKKNAAELAVQINKELDKHGTKVTVFSFEGKPEKLPEGKWDIAISLGGDGTVLYTARCLAPLGVPILPINLGTLGFIAEVDQNDWFDVFKKWERSEIKPALRCMFDISVERIIEQEPKTIMKNICLNDAVISYTEIAKLIKLDVHINSNTTLGSYRCDGLVIATPTGSTAYSMAAGGPILDPEMEAMILNPICPFALSNRPLVLPSRQTLVITVADKQRSGVLLTIDGQDTFALECGDKIFIRQAPYSAELIFDGRYAYYSALRNKLFWSGDSNA
ncbi:MAG: NAD(+)/NADH kinase [Treponema sp.]|nr:NAD(+)/NADH kinase [Treponema sp.]